MTNANKPSMKEVFQMIYAALQTNPAATEGANGVYQFNLKGDDGGTYQIIIDDQGARTVEGTEKEADCILEMEAEDYRQLIAGALNATEAFMSGRLAIQGDLGAAMKLQGVLSAFSF